MSTPDTQNTLIPALPCASGHGIDHYSLNLVTPPLLRSPGGITGMCNAMLALSRTTNELSIYHGRRMVFVQNIMKVQGLVAVTPDLRWAEITNALIY